MTWRTVRVIRPRPVTGRRGGPAGFAEFPDGGLDQGPQDLGQQLLAGAHPAVEGGPVNAEAPGQGLHVDAVTAEEGPACVPEGVERGRPRRGGPCELAPQRRIRGARIADCHPGCSFPSAEVALDMPGVLGNSVQHIG